MAYVRCVGCGDVSGVATQFAGTLFSAVTFQRFVRHTLEVCIRLFLIRGLSMISLAFVL